MANSDKTGKPGAKDPFAMQMAGLEPMLDALQRGFAGSASANGDWFKRMMDANSEVTRFVQQRLARDRDVMAALARCKTPPDTAMVYAEFIETAMKEYSEEMTKLADLYAAQANWAMSEMQQRLEAAGEAAGKGAGKGAGGT